MPLPPNTRILTTVSLEDVVEADGCCMVLSDATDAILLLLPVLAVRDRRRGVVALGVYAVVMERLQKVQHNKKLKKQQPSIIIRSSGKKKIN